MNAVIIISAIINLIAIIVFFVMASNVSKIKKHLSAFHGKRYLEMANEEQYLENKEKAKEYLLRAKYCYKVKKEAYYDDKGEWRDRSVVVSEIDRQLSDL